MFYLMDAVPGRILIDASMPEQTPAERTAISIHERRAGRLHQVDPAKVGLGDYGRTGHYIARQVARWSKQYAELKTEDIPAMDKLTRGCPSTSRPRIPPPSCMATTGWENLIVHPTEPRIVAVLDWELSTWAIRLRRRLQLPGLSSSRATTRLRQGPISGDSACRPRRRMWPPTAGVPAATPSSTGTTTWRSRCSGWQPSPGRLSPWPARQFLQSGVDKNEHGARERAELAWSLVQ